MLPAVLNSINAKQSLSLASRGSEKCKFQTMYTTLTPCKTYAFITFLVLNATQSPCFCRDLLSKLDQNTVGSTNVRLIIISRNF